MQSLIIRACDSQLMSTCPIERNNDYRRAPREMTLSIFGRIIMQSKCCCPIDASCTSQCILSRQGDLKVNNKLAAERTAATDLAVIELSFASFGTSAFIDSKSWWSSLSKIHSFNICPRSKIQNSVSSRNGWIIAFTFWKNYLRKIYIRTWKTKFVVTINHGFLKFISRDS